MGRAAAVAVTRGYSDVNLGADYSDDEREFMVALDRYKRENRRPHPTCSEVLKVLRSLGYEKPHEAR